MVGIAIGLAVMIISAAIAGGFQKGVRHKISSIGADVYLTGPVAAGTFEPSPIMVDSLMMEALCSIKDVTHAQRYALRPGMIMTGDNYQGAILKGIGEDYDQDFLRDALVEGRVPDHSDPDEKLQVLISSEMASSLQLGAGEKMTAYFLDGERVRARKFIVAGIYDTHFTKFDELFIFADITVVSRLSGLAADYYNGVEFHTAPGAGLESVKEEIADVVSATRSDDDSQYYVYDLSEAYSGLFEWLALLDINVWVILALMTAVSGFTVIAGLLIVILERTSMIGLFKAMGASDSSIRQIFVSLSALVILRGMMWGNIIAMAFILAESSFRFIHLDPSVYYISYVPVSISPMVWILINLATLVISVAMLIAPSYLISRINPARTMRFE